jgi:hypothetical protein
MLGFGALGEFALGEGPTQIRGFSGGQWQTPVRKAGLAAAVIATTFVGFVPPPPAKAAGPFTKFSTPHQTKYVRPTSWHFVAPAPAQQTAIFSSFSQPQLNRVLIDEIPSTFFEPAAPPAPPFVGFATFEGVIKAKFNAALISTRWWQPITLPVDTHDGVFVKRKKKRSGPDPLDIELEEKAKRRAALELAVYGPETAIPGPIPAEIPVINTPPPDVADLAKVMMALRQDQIEQAKAAEIQADEDDLESILKDIL